MVYEAYRVIELLLKGIICFSGYTPCETHEIDNLLERFCKILLKIKNQFPFFLAACDKKGNCYGVIINGNTIRLLKRVCGIYTQIGSTRLSDFSTDRLLRLRLEVSDKVIRLFCQGKELIANPDYSISYDVKIKRGFVKQPDPVRLKRLKILAQKLRRSREHAFYSTKVYSEKGALAAISIMNEAFEATKIFFCC